jgi:DNA-directed RNA polymerase specialized sigma24 family protein
MTCLKSNRTKQNKASEFASREDFGRVFAENLNSLYQLSLLLAGPEKAEECFVAALDDAARPNRVFRDWAHSWTRRSIIQHAIRAIQPHPVAGDSPISDAEQEHFSLNDLLALGDFERFVFVMSVLEHYPKQECAVLLGCSVRDILEARIRAVQQLGSLNGVLTWASSGQANTESLIAVQPPVTDEGVPRPAA